MRWLLTVAVVTAACAATAAASAASGRNGKFFNVFQVISFANGPCQGGSRNGTCYTEAECSERGGTNGGSCAAGFGVCCIVSVDCGGTSSENCTYFESSSPMAGTCQATICPCGNNICQLRLDFDNFVITGPSTSTITVTKRIINSGTIGPIGTKTTQKQVSMTSCGQCLTDTFSITNPDGITPPTICGTNTGEHMYVESSDCCNDLKFQLGSTGVGTSLATKSWTIKVTQFSCNHPNLAPQGCTQYFFGATTDMVRSFNYNNGNGKHLANQDQQICVRRERGFCRLCWTTVQDNDFALSGSMKSISLNKGKLCCSYGAKTTFTKAHGFDCVHIPGALNNVANPVPIKSNICGNNKGLAGHMQTASLMTTSPATLCTVRTPFSINFRSDRFEVVMESMVAGGNTGFELVYFMDAIGCNAANVNAP